MFYQVLRPFLFSLPPEDAHKLTLQSLEHGLFPKSHRPDPACLRVGAFGIDFSNPLAIAAGFDKDARVPDAVLKLGCGFAEVGTTTPRPQSGNPEPRVFRLTEDDALINRLGFNNKGHAAALNNLRRLKPNGPVCVNIGANKDSDNRVADYVSGLNTFYDLAAFFVINISSPNTPGLRDLQAPQALRSLLSALVDARAERVRDGAPQRPLVVKLAPDIHADDLENIIAEIRALPIDGMAISNTTLARTGLRSSAASESGGLSGRPLFDRATRMLAQVYQMTSGALPLIGIGGIDSGARALEKIEAGATLLELYTGLIYRGPGLIGEIKSHLEAACRNQGVASVSDLTGRKAAHWAEKENVS